MGVCCSKPGMAVKERAGKPPEKESLLKENVCEIIPNSGSSHLIENAGEDVVLPVIQDPQTVPTQEAEAINTYNQENNSAARSTLIFPSFSGYRHQDPFALPKKQTVIDTALTAFVTPFQSTSSSPNVNRRTADFLSQRNSPFMSRYSPLLRDNRERQTRLGVFEQRTPSSRRGSVESGDFDSDIEQSSDETNSHNVDRTSEVKSQSEQSPHSDSRPIAHTISTQSEMADASTGADASAPSSSIRNSQIQTTNLHKTLASVSTSTDVVVTKPNTKNKSTKSEIPSEKTTDAASSVNKVSKLKSIGTEASTKEESKVDMSTGTDEKLFIKTVDACVGTNSDQFFRSKAVLKTQTDKKKNSKRMTSSTGTGTETVGIAVGTDTPDFEETATFSSTSNSTTAAVNTINMVDVCVGTDSDDFHRFVNTRKIQVDLKKKKKVKTSSIATEANTADIEVETSSIKRSPKPAKKPIPKLIAEKALEQRSKRDLSRTPSPKPNIEKENKPEPHPIIETLENAFMRFAKYGEINSEGLEMNNKNWAKLCRDCDFVDNRNILVGDIDVIFSRHKPKGHRVIAFDMFINCLNEVADRRFGNKIKDEWTRREIIYQNVIGKAPELIGITGVSKTGNVGRMTDHHLYPASHKMRFDEEGRGLGVEEKFEIHDFQMGYVQGYKDRDTYDHKLLGITREKSGASLASMKLSSPRTPQRPRSSASNRSHE